MDVDYKIHSCRAVLQDRGGFFRVPRHQPEDVHV